MLLAYSYEKIKEKVIGKRYRLGILISVRSNVGLFADFTNIVKRKIIIVMNVFLCTDSGSTKFVRLNEV